MRPLRGPLKIGGPRLQPCQPSGKSGLEIACRTSVVGRDLAIPKLLAWRPYEGWGLGRSDIVKLVQGFRLHEVSKYVVFLYFALWLITG